MTMIRQPPDGEAGTDFAGDILTIARNGDRAAFARLFEHFAPRLKSFLVGQGLPVLVAEELAQETMLAVWRKAASFDPARAGAGTWIFTIARNRRIDWLRRDQVGETVEDPGEAPADAETPDAEALVSAAEQERRLRASLRLLSPDHLAVIRLSFFMDKSHSEIAAALRLPLGTVKSRIRLAMDRLRGLLGEF